MSKKQKMKQAGKNNYLITDFNNDKGSYINADNILFDSGQIFFYIGAEIVGIVPMNQFIITKSSK